MHCLSDTSQDGSMIRLITNNCGIQTVMEMSLYNADNATQSQAESQVELKTDSYIDGLPTYTYVSLVMSLRLTLAKDNTYYLSCMLFLTVHVIACKNDTKMCLTQLQQNTVIIII